MKDVISFLSDLKRNNDKEWFDRNKDRHKTVLSTFNTLTKELIAGIAAFDPSVGGLQVRDCTYRIYRDLRFSADKTPYKTYMGVYVCRGGKKSNYAGYYLHVEPGKGPGFYMTASLYCPEPKILKSVREDILDHGDELLRAIDRAEGFSLNRDNVLKRNPAGFPTETPHDDLLRLKDVMIEMPLTEKFLTSPRLAERATSEFKKTKPFIDQLNRAVDFALEEY